MVFALLVVPIQKGPYGEGGRKRGFLLPLVEEAAVVGLVLLLVAPFFVLFDFFWNGP